MTDEEWEEYVKWWKSKWGMSAPNRESVEQYLNYLKERRQKLEARKRRL